MVPLKLLLRNWCCVLKKKKKCVLKSLFWPECSGAGGRIVREDRPQPTGPLPAAKAPGCLRSVLRAGGTQGLGQVRGERPGSSAGRR